MLGIYLVTFCKIQNISHKILAHCSLPRKEVKEDSNNLIDSFRWVEDGEGGGKESAHSCPDGWEVGRVQDVAPVLHWFLDVHVQEDVGPFGSGLLPSRKINSYTVARYQGFQTLSLQNSSVDKAI